MIDLPLPPNHHASAVLFLAVLALWLFTRKNLTLETASFMILIGLAMLLVPMLGGGARRA